MFEVSSNQKNFVKSVKRRKAKVSFLRLFILIAFLAVWEFSAKYGLIDEFIFSCPSAMAKAALYMIKDGTLFYHTGITAAETIVGFMMGTLLGTAAAILLWWNKTASVQAVLLSPSLY